MGRRPIYLPARVARGFGLVELLVVIAILVVLIALLLPAIMSARLQAKTVLCATNMRQITAALINYATDNRGNFPPSVHSDMNDWCSSVRIGPYLKACRPMQNGRYLAGSVLVCPMEPEVACSYAISWYASCIPAGYKHIPPLDSTLNWNLKVRNPSRMMLLFEGWRHSQLPYSRPWPTIGGLVPPGRSFGAGGGITVEYWAPVWVWIDEKLGHVNCELPYDRHRLPSMRFPTATPVGRVNIGYADGHVALKSNDELADFSTGLSRLDSWWTPRDDQIDH